MCKHKCCVSLCFEIRERLFHQEALMMAVCCLQQYQLPFCVSAVAPVSNCLLHRVTVVHRQVLVAWPHEGCHGNCTLVEAFDGAAAANFDGYVILMLAPAVASRIVMTITNSSFSRVNYCADSFFVFRPTSVRVFEQQQRQQQQGIAMVDFPEHWGCGYRIRGVIYCCCCCCCCSQLQWHCS